MLTFIVPVKSEQVSSSWSEFCSLFERTLLSICNQTNNNFKVVAVCHEIPHITFKHPNVHFIQVDFAPPIKKEASNNDDLQKLREIDKGRKLQIGAKFAKDEFNADYVMIADSDDFVSNRIAEFVNKHNGDAAGWYIKNGYIYLEGKPFLLKTFKFNELCGSSLIVKPDLLQYFFGVDPILYFDHRLKVLNGAISLEILPFYGGIYSIANGENHFMHSSNIKNFNNHKGWLSPKGLRRLFSKLKNYRLKLITKKLKQEFNFRLP